MKTTIKNLFLLGIILLLGCTPSPYGSQKSLSEKEKITGPLKDASRESPVAFDDNRQVTWSSDFELVEIESEMDGHRQKAYFHTSKSGEPMPLIVSLHTWSGDYSQKDPVAE